MKGYKMKNCLIVTLLSGLLLSGCTTGKLTSHHASVNVHFPEGISSEEALAGYEKVIETVKVWAADSDLYLVEDPSDKSNLTIFTTNPNADVRQCFFRDKLSSEGPMPLQAMSSYDVNDASQVVHIVIIEGYSEEPSKRLKQISKSLHSRLAQMNKKTTYRIQ